MWFSGMKNDNIFCLLGVLVLQKSSKILLCASLEGEPGPYCSLTVPPLSLHPLPSLISNCLQGFLPRNPTGSSGLSVSATPFSWNGHHTPWGPC